MRDLYTKNAEAFVIVYSITSLSTFTELSSYVAQIYSMKASDVPLVIVGNKVCSSCGFILWLLLQVDLEDERVVTTTQGEEFAKKYNAAFFETRYLLL